MRSSPAKRRARQEAALRRKANRTVRHFRWRCWWTWPFGHAWETINDQGDQGCVNCPAERYEHRDPNNTIWRNDGGQGVVIK